MEAIIVRFNFGPDRIATGVRYVMDRTPVPLRLVRAPPVGSAGHSAGMTDGGSGDADTINSGPKWAASEANLRDHAVRLRKRCWRYCLCRSCDG